MGGPCFVFLYEQIPARGALIALDLTRCAQVEAASSNLPATFQKENTILTDGVSFCDCPQVLLSALPPTARKGECEGETFDGFPHSRSITRPQATTFAQQKCRTKKEEAHERVSLLFCLPHMEKIFQRFRGWEVYHGNLFPDLRHQYSTSASTSSPPIKTTRIFSLDSTTTHRRICRIT